MANGLLDLLGGLGTTPPSYLEGLLGAQQTEDLRKRSIGTGLANALVGYLAMPKNQNLGLGRILAGTAQAGLEGAKGVYTNALGDYETQQKIEEMKRQKASREAYDKAVGNIYTQTPATFETITRAGGYAPQQSEIQQDQISPNFNLNKLPDISTQVETAPEQQVLNKNALMQMMASGDPRAAGYLTGLKTLKEITTPTKADLVKAGENEALYDPTSGKWIISPTAKKKDQFSDPYVLGGQMVQQNLATGEIRQAVTQPNSITVTNAGESEYNKKFGSILGESDAQIVQIARGAPETVATSRRIRTLLKQNPITGTGASALLPLSTALSTAGITQDNTAASTQALVGELANVTLNNVKGSGLGAGQGFTDKDREFLESAKSGKIDYTATNIQRVADLNERSAMKSIEKYDELRGRLKPEQQTFFGLNPIRVQGTRPTPVIVKGNGG